MPNAFIQSDMPEGETVIMILRDEIADLLVEVAPDVYGDYLITTKDGRRMIYVKLLKAIYGLLQSSLLFYLHITEFLVKKLKFVLNPYDPCIANKMINGSQFTVVWHVDDLKVSHLDKNNEIRVFINLIKAKYEDEKIGKVKVNCGTKHKYLGMDLDFSELGNIIVTMKDYIDNMLNEFNSEIKTKCAMLAAKFLFQTHEDVPKLNKEQVANFNTNVARSLFLSK